MGVEERKRPRLRPRFKLCSSVTPDQLCTGVQTRLREGDVEMRGLVLDGRIELNVPAEERHFWSPQLTVDVYYDESLGTTCLKGRYGPAPQVWTMYMALNAVMLMAILGASIFAIAEVTIGDKPWALLAVPPPIVGLFIVYLLPFVGQSFAQEQMFKLRQFLTDAADTSAHPEDPGDPVFDRMRSESPRAPDAQDAA